jgi:predicted ribosome quality control (RQC) complex YloA/Tae2 family protein
MRQAFRIVVLSFTCCSLFALGQDDASLGDAARLARQQKQQKGTQAKGGQSKDAQPAKTPKVITNDEIPGHPPVSASSASADQPRGANYSQPSGKVSVEQFKSRILAQENMISSMQSEVDELNDSIRFAPANCVANCVQWNQRQRDKQQEVERLQAQLEDQKKRLEDMQESARQQGYGSSVYDP